MVLLTIVACVGALITGMGPQENGILSNSWLPPVNGTLPDVSPISGAGKVYNIIISNVYVHIHSPTSASAKCIIHTCLYRSQKQCGVLLRQRIVAR